KSDSKRVAIAQGRALLSAGSLDLIKEKKFKKGDVISIATLAGITGAKQCSTLIPLCHQINLTSVKVNIEVDSKKNSLEVTSTVTTLGKTGVEMEALTAVSTALLTIYDMVKSVDKSVCLTDIRLIEKRGGKSGLFRANDS
ncbi:MAG: cyclic pyranopterin monophosphate synthase MoaC, partial [Nitrospinota bacterium]